MTYYLSENVRFVVETCQRSYFSLSSIINDTGVGGTFVHVPRIRLHEITLKINCDELSRSMNDLYTLMSSKTAILNTFQIFLSSAIVDLAN